MSTIHGISTGSNPPHALPFLSKLMELQSTEGQLLAQQGFAEKYGAVFMVGSLPVPAGSADPMNNPAVPVFAASLIEASMHTKTSMEGLWQRILAVGRQLLSASEQTSHNGQPMPEIGMAVNKPGLQHLGRLLGDVYRELDVIGAELTELQNYLDRAIQEFSGQASLGDRGDVGTKPSQQEDSQDTYGRLVQSCLTCGLPVDTLLLGLSDLHVHARRLLAEAVVKGGCALSPELADVQAQLAAGGQWKPPDQFRRSTTKYWVRMSDVPRLRIALLRHLPVLVFGRDEGALLKRLQETLDQRGCSDVGLSLQAMSTGATEQSASSLITSVYFDAPKPPGSEQGSKPDVFRVWPFSRHETPQVAIMRSPLPVYHSRLRRDDGATLVRTRWYGPQPDPATGQIFVERKLHREGWTGESSVKERARMPLAELSSYLQGNAPEQDSDKKKQGGASRKEELLNEVQHFLTSLNQESVMRTTYRRTAFQQSNTNEVRISLDTQVVMSVERPSPSRPWTATMGDGGPHGARDRVELPFAILEIKLQDGDSCPDWVMAARKSGMLVEVPKFSKFQHGMTMLYPDLVRNTPTWFLPEAAPAPAPAATSRGLSIFRAAPAGAVVMTPATIEEMAEACKRDRPEEREKSGMFPEEIAADERANAKPSPLLHPKAHLGDSSCPACAAALAMAGQPCDISEDSMGHTCDLGRTCVIACTWAMPAAPEGVKQAVLGTKPTSAYASAPSGVTLADVRTGLTSQSPFGAASLAAAAVAAPQPTPDQLHTQPAPQTAFLHPGNASSGSSWGGSSSAPVAVVPSLTKAAKTQNTGNASSGLESGSEASSDAKDMQVHLQRDGKAGGSSKQQELVAGPWGNMTTKKGDSVHVVVKEVLPGTEAVSGKRAALGGVRRAGRASWRWLVAQAQRARRPGAGGGDGDEETGQSANPRAAAIIRSRVEPKTFFAAERTLLSWLNLSVLLLFVAFSLLANVSSYASRANPSTVLTPFSGSAGASSTGVSAATPPGAFTGPAGQLPMNGTSAHSGGGALLVAVCGTSGPLCKAGLVCGVAIAPVALLFMLYALFMYRCRTAQILRRDTVRFDDQRGPVVLVLVLVTLLVISLALTISMMREQ